MLKNVGWDDFRNTGISVNHAGIRIIQAYELNMNNIDQKSFNSWSIQEIKDSDIQIIDGDRGNNYPKKEEFSDSGFCLFLNTGNIQDDKFAFNRCDFISENKDHQLRKGKLQRDDIVLTTRGTVGNLAYYHQGISIENIRINSGMIILRCGVGINSQFLYQLLKSQMMKEQYMLYSSGSAQPQLPIRDFNRIKILLPPLTQQQQIAEILSAYDDLIETNNQRIATLEQLAQQIYKEWFVRMRFPGWETTPFYYGIPDGWVVSKVKNTFEIVGGGTPSKDTGANWVEGNINWFTPTDLTSAKRILIKESSLKCNETGYKQSSAKIFPAYSVMMTSRATIGTAAINTVEACTNQGFITCIPNEKISYPYLFYWIKQNKEQFILLASGATFLEISKATFNKIDILLPPKVIMNKYSDLVFPLFIQIENLHDQMDILTKTRNLLLPRLISGKLTIKQAEALTT
ncbi:MAG: restriction endonuclease subunit S [Methylovulum sp.]|nr:restriction endonuclease subunit S [Methylovulum sp.]MCF8000123.1 restriction endonuclease subunit S [Methylovulum sp.]